MKPMAFQFGKKSCREVAGASPAQFDDWRKAWRAAADGGSTEPLLTFIARERGVAEDVFMQKLAAALGWPYLDLPKLTIADGGAQQNLHEDRVPIFRPARRRSTTACCRSSPATRLTRR